ncbi:dCTP diphosphatase [Sarracenia purpurea var. burkii]
MTGGLERESGVGLDDLKKKMADFARERDWDQFHSPRNLLLALVGEVGELSEIFQWKGEVPRGLPDWEEKEKEHLGEELSDVLLYLVRLADTCGVDLGKAALRKLELNAIKYPPNLCHGSSKKHTHFTTTTTTTSATKSSSCCCRKSEEINNIGVDGLTKKAMQ